MQHIVLLFLNPQPHESTNSLGLTILSDTLIVEVVDISLSLCGLVNIHHYSPPLKWRIVYHM